MEKVSYLDLGESGSVDNQWIPVTRPPRQYTHRIENWDCQTKEECFELLEKISKGGWELITIANGLAYFSRINLEYLAYLEAQNKREMSRKAKRYIEK